VVDVAQELFAHGFADEARVLLEREVDLFETDPFYVESPNSRALVLMGLGRNEEANLLAEQVVSEGLRGPGYQYGALAVRGITAARSGDTLEAKAVEEEVEGLSYSSRGFVRAQIRAALGDEEGAVRLLERALYQDGHPYTITLHRNPDLLTLRGYPPFEELMAPKG
jgi:hypothetical protein